MLQIVSAKPRTPAPFSSAEPPGGGVSAGTAAPGALLRPRPRRRAPAVGARSQPGLCRPAVPGGSCACSRLGRQRQVGRVRAHG
eukprot:184938-Chlamydomonas_euryale.AAC.2